MRTTILLACLFVTACGHDEAAETSSQENTAVNQETGDSEERQIEGETAQETEAAAAKEVKANDAADAQESLLSKIQYIYRGLEEQPITYASEAESDAPSTAASPNPDPSL